jgi:diacylglycerol O-acyltransferase / wax synthase
VERLTGLDGAFASLDSPTAHLHILGVLVFDPCEVGDGPDFDRVRDLVAGRVALVPPFRKRMVEVPFGLQHPTMVDDPEFDIDYHVRRVSVPQPGGLAELAELAADLASRPLDRRRPLWEFHVVEGLEHGRLALIPKVHHSIIDGVSAAEVLAAFFDLSPEPVPQPLFPRRSGTRTRPGAVDAQSPPNSGDPSWAPPPLPGEWQRWRDVLRSLPGTADAVVRTVSRTVQTARSLNGRNRESGGSVPPAPFEAPRTSINRAISPRRRVAFARLPLDQVGRVRSVLGGTANDVVLAAASGALRSFFAGRGEVPEGSLVAMVPVSVRVDEERGTLGNRVSALLVSLASGVGDAEARLAAIRSGVRSAKDQMHSVDPDLFAGWAQAMVPALATRLTRLTTNVRLFDHVTPIFNVIVSNVPGPEFPLYLAGSRMVAMYPLGPIIEGAGVNITVFSYLSTMYVGVQGCWDLVPDLEAIASGMEESLAELVQAADRRDRPIPWWHSELPA